MVNTLLRMKIQSKDCRQCVYMCLKAISRYTYNRNQYHSLFSNSAWKNFVCMLSRIAINMLHVVP